MAENFEPTPAEKLMAWRRRAGRTQAEMADWLNIPLHLYGDIERGLVDMDRSLSALSDIHLTMPEKLTAIRRRLGISQRIVAAELGVCRMTAAAMEECRTDPEPLIKLLEQRGLSVYDPDIKGVDECRATPRQQ